MLLGHARVGVTQLRRDNAHWDAAPGQGAGVGVPQTMECRGRLKPGPGARLLERSLLMRGPQALPSSRVKMRSRDDRPAVS